jgi:hypothetical protein
LGFIASPLRIQGFPPRSDGLRDNNPCLLDFPLPGREKIARQEHQSPYKSGGKEKNSYGKYLKMPSGHCLLM